MIFAILVVIKVPNYSYKVPGIRLWFLVNDGLIVLVKQRNNVKADSDKVDSGRINGAGLGIEIKNIGRIRNISLTKDIGRPRAVEAKG